MVVLRQSIFSRETRFGQLLYVYIFSHPHRLLVDGNKTTHRIDRPTVTLKTMATTSPPSLGDMAIEIQIKILLYAVYTTCSPGNRRR